MKYREFTRKLVKGGYQLIRHGKNHDIYEGPDGTRVSIRIHSGEVPKGYEKYLK